VEESIKIVDKKEYVLLYQDDSYRHGTMEQSWS
jgi:hypothetical protein